MGDLLAQEALVAVTRDDAPVAAHLFDHSCGRLNVTGGDERSEGGLVRLREEREAIVGQAIKKILREFPRAEAGVEIGGARDDLVGQRH